MILKFNSIFRHCLLGCFVTATLTACQDIMDVDSTRVAFEENHALNHPNDSIYSVMGVLAEIQQLSDRCLLFGELRADLMTIDPQNATTDLQQICNFGVTEGNAYNNRRDFYRVINECNYILQRMDTTLTVGVERVMMPEYAQVRTLRAWTYWQMALIYGRVGYTDQPLLSVSDFDAVKTMKQVGLDELANLLIADLQPVCEVRPLDYGTVDGWATAEMFLPTKALLADLYLYMGRYEEAAQTYYDLIWEHGYTVRENYANYWTAPTRETLAFAHSQAYRDEVITRQVFSSDQRACHSMLGRLTYSQQPQLLPVPSFATAMANRNHFHTDNRQGISRYFLGDLRGEAVFASGRTNADAFGHVAVGEQRSRLLITKFFNNLTGSATDPLENRYLTSLAILRPSVLYLRLAEAINRLGRPTAAFAVLKYGLNHATLSDTLRIDTAEISPLPTYLNFNDDRFSSNIGTAARGCGLGIVFDRALYVIPEGVDSVDFVEKAILEELASETCFEGNRFFDLLCVSRHREGHPAFMAEQVSRKYASPEIMRQQLLTLDSWFVK